MTPEIKQYIDGTVARLLALRELTRDTGMSTTRTQRQIMQSLPDDILPEVALLLKERDGVPSETR